MLLRIAFTLGRRPLQAALGDEVFRRTRRAALESLPSYRKQLPPTPAHPGAKMFLSLTCDLVAFHRALPERSAAENSALLQEALRHAARWVPRPVRRLYRWMFFQPWYYRHLAGSVIGGGGFEGTLEEDRASQQVIVTYTACGIQQLLRRLGADDLGPHICSLDELESEIFGLGLTRTGTIGRGAACCDFRWTKPPS